MGDAQALNPKIAGLVKSPCNSGQACPARLPLCLCWEHCKQNLCQYLALVKNFLGQIETDLLCSYTQEQILRDCRQKVPADLNLQTRTVDTTACPSLVHTRRGPDLLAIFSCYRLLSMVVLTHTK